MAETKYYNLPGEGFVNPSQNPDTLRIEIYWKNKGQWAQIAEAEPYKGMIEEAQRVLVRMMDAIQAAEVSNLTDDHANTKPTERSVS